MLVKPEYTKHYMVLNITRFDTVNNHINISRNLQRQVCLLIFRFSRYVLRATYVRVPCTIHTYMYVQPH